MRLGPQTRMGHCDGASCCLRAGVNIGARCGRMGFTRRRDRIQEFVGARCGRLVFTRRRDNSWVWYYFQAFLVGRGGG